MLHHCENDEDERRQWKADREEWRITHAAVHTDYETWLRKMQALHTQRETLSPEQYHQQHQRLRADYDELIPKIRALTLQAQHMKADVQARKANHTQVPHATPSPLGGEITT